VPSGVSTLNIVESTFHNPEILSNPINEKSLPQFKFLLKNNFSILNYDLFKIFQIRYQISLKSSVAPNEFHWQRFMAIPYTPPLGAK
jgi:hypothetical protein